MIADGAWHHVAITFGASQVLTIFKDSVSVAACSLSAPFNVPASPGMWLGWNGNMAHGSGEPWTGAIARARVFNYELTPSQVLVDFNLPCASARWVCMPCAWASFEGAA